MAGEALGGGVTGLGAIRALARSGAPRILVAPAGDLATRSRRNDRIWSDLAETSDPNTLEAALHERLEEAVLIPCSDNWATAAAHLRRELTGRFRPIVASPAVLEQLVDKASFAETLAGLGIPQPRTFLVEAGQPPPLGPGTWFLKPRDSQSFSTRFGVKAFSIRSDEEALARVGEAAGAGLEVVLQEYVPGPPTAHVFVDGYVDREGRILDLFARRRVRMFPLDFGNSTALVSIPAAEIGPAVEHVRTLLAGLEYRGIFSVELKQDARDGIFRMLELNARAWWYVDFAARCGVDVCWLAYRDALGLEPEPTQPYEVGRRCVLLSSDLRALRELRRTGRLGLREWLRFALGATQPIFDAGDPLPAFAHLAQVARRSASR